MKTKLLTIAATGLLFMAACKGKTDREGTDTVLSDSVRTDTGVAVKPKGPAPAWAPDIKPEMQAVIEKLASYGDKPIPQLTPAEARKNHTPTDAVMDLIKENNIPKPVFKVDTMGKDITVSGGKIHVRMYTPKTGKGAYPVIVYYHGGGFVIADLDVYDASANALAEGTDAIVVSVAYRLAPEHKFPTAHDDAYAAYEWVLANAASFKGDAKKVALAGESAGGNLAVNTAIKARNSNKMLPSAILAVYPVAGSDMGTESYKKYEAAKPLDKLMMGWFVKHYLNNLTEAQDERINLLAANLKCLPATTIITAQIDPLQTEGTKLAGKLKGAGVPVNIKNYDGVTHEFFGMGAIVPQAKDAMIYATDQLKKAFGI